MSYLRGRVILNNSLTSEEVRLEAFSAIEAELRREEYQAKASKKKPWLY